MKAPITNVNMSSSSWKSPLKNRYDEAKPEKPAVIIKKAEKQASPVQEESRMESFKFNYDDPSMFFQDGKDM